MAVLNLDYLKTLFETYDKPTEEDFSDLIDTLSTTIDIVTYNIPLSGDVWTAVNNSTTIKHDQKQLTVIYQDGQTFLFDAPLGEYGVTGIPTVEANYVVLLSSQFTDTEVEKILELITKDVSITTSTSIDKFEQGLSTSVTYNATIHHEDVTVTSIKLNGVPQPISTSGVTTVTNTTSLFITKTYTLVVDYIRLGLANTQTYINYVVSYVPQYSGLSAVLDYDALNVSGIALPKYIKETSELEYSAVLNDFYLWFILNDTNMNIHDQNGLQFRDGIWSGDTYFIKKEGTIQLDDNTVVTTTFYRSLDTVDSKGINFKFKSK